MGNEPFYIGLLLGLMLATAVAVAISERHRRQPVRPMRTRQVSWPSQFHWWDGN